MGGCASAPDAAPNPRNTRVTVLPRAWLWPGALTHDDLLARRQTFWETAPSSGRPIVWSNLRIVCEALLNDNAELASGIISAGGLVLPRGDLSVAPSVMLYDSLGSSYDLPRFLWSTPRNLLSVDEAAARASAARRALKPKGSVAAEPLSVKVRIAGTSTTIEQDVPLALSTATTVEEFRVALDAALASGEHDRQPDETIRRPNAWRGRGLPTQRQRIMFRGRELKEAAVQFFEIPGLVDGAILQVFIRPE
jgi:hypothetical protein